MGINEMLDEQIRSVLDAMSQCECGSDAWTRANDELGKLYKLRLDEMKIEYAHSDAVKSHEMEDYYKNREFEIREKDQSLKEDELNERIKEREDDVTRHETDVKHECESQSKERILNAIRLGIDIAGIVLPLVFYGKWMRAGYEYEQTGIVCSPTFKNFINKMRPKG